MRFPARSLTLQLRRHRPPICCGIDAHNHAIRVGSLANNATGLSNANGSAGGIILADIAQSIDLTQANTIDNAIGVYNSAAIGSGIGINAVIDTQDIGGLSNSILGARTPMAALP